MNELGILEAFRGSWVRDECVKGFEFGSVTPFLTMNIETETTKKKFIAIN